MRGIGTGVINLVVAQLALGALESVAEGVKIAVTE